MTLTDEIPTGEIMTVPEVAAYLKFDASHVYRLVKQGKLPHFRVGQSPRIRRVDLEKWIEAGLVAVATH